MSETQIYKWWWDQTRKRMKKLKKATGTKLLSSQAQSDLDEFGRLSGGLSSTGGAEVTKRRRNSTGNPDEGSDINRICIDSSSIKIEITNKDAVDQKKESQE